MALALALGACATGDGKTLRPPTAPPPVTEAPVDPEIEFGELDGLGDPTELDAEPTLPGDDLDGFDDLDDIGDGGAAEFGFELVAPWRSGAVIDARYGCDGLDVSPALAWTSVPDDAMELAITVLDVDAEGLVHWIVVGIDPSHRSSPEGGLPPGAVPHRNSFGELGWSGPCPPTGETHVYRFSLHALSEPVDLNSIGEGADELTASEAVARIDQLTIEHAIVEGVAGR